MDEDRGMNGIAAAIGLKDRNLLASNFGGNPQLIDLYESRTLAHAFAGAE
jgi:hypothetical protein